MTKQISNSDDLELELYNNALSFLEKDASVLIEKAQRTFTAKARAEIEGKLPSRLKDSYILVSSLQAWRKAVYEAKSEALHNLFLEAQNDALLSFTLAHMGMWRPALQALRSMLEGIVRVSYFNEHPVEFYWWQQQRYRISTTETLKTYFPGHPKIEATKLVASSFPDFLATLAKEYSTLSLAVHASTKAFFMTKLGNIEISTDEQKHYGPWYTRHSTCIESVNLLLLCLHQDDLVGTKNRELRQLLSLVIPKQIFGDIKKLNVNLR